MNTHLNFQNVQKKAKEFESYPEDRRTDFTRSELARLSKKVLLPNVTERAHEYEVKRTTTENLRKDPSSTSTVSAGSTSMPKRIQRDSRSLDSSGIIYLMVHSVYIYILINTGIINLYVHYRKECKWICMTDY